MSPQFFLHLWQSLPQGKEQGGLEIESLPPLAKIQRLRGPSVSGRILSSKIQPALPPATGSQDPHRPPALAAAPCVGCWPHCWCQWRTRKSIAMLGLPKEKGIPKIMVAWGKCLAVSYPATVYRLRAERSWLRIPAAAWLSLQREWIRSQAAVLSHLQPGCCPQVLTIIKAWHFNAWWDLVFEPCWMMSCLPAGQRALNPAALRSEVVVQLLPWPRWVWPPHCCCFHPWRRMGRGFLHHHRSPGKGVWARAAQKQQYWCYFSLLAERSWEAGKMYEEMRGEAENKAAASPP